MYPCHDSAVQPMVVAHRGASADRAEHTLDAYALAVRQGAEGLECDVRLSRDGHLVCVHDRRVNRTSNGRGLVSELSLAKLSELDYASWHHAEPGSADELIEQRNAVPSAPEPQGVLTLESLLGLVADTGVTLFVETKHPVRYAGLVESKLIALLSRHGLARPVSKEDSSVVVMSFSARAMRRVHRLAPMLPTVQLVGVPRSRRRGDTLPSASDTLGPGIGVLRDDPGYVARAATFGHDVYCWTVDRPEDIRLCQRLGVRYLATNTPAAARELLHAR